MNKAFNIEVDGEGFAKLIFDLPGEKVNKFSTPVMLELKELLKELSGRDDIKAMAVVSPKENIFIAGADIKELEVITEVAEAREKALQGQSVFRLLESLPFPTVAVIDGACLGGGLEFAMACTYRIVSDNPKTLLGCPEVQLGILPGWGGTQRLPRLVGLVAALPMLLAGKPARGDKAVKIKLADRLISHDFIEERTDEFLRECATEKGRAGILAKRKRHGTQKKLLEDNPFGRAFVFSHARKDMMKKTGGHYPAPIRILKVLEETFSKPLMWGLQIEAEAFGDLGPTRVSKNLIKLFFTNEALKKDKGVEGDVERRELDSAGVLGAGVMGGGISWLFSSKGMPVRMKDINWEAVGKGLAEAQAYFRQLLKRRKLKPADVELGMHRISGTLDYTGFDRKNVIVEAVIEKMELKKSVIAELEESISDDAIICSNTSALSITEMGSALKRPERFLGMHFFNPVNRMPLVEVIPGEKTSPETIASTIALVKKLGKTPVVVQNCVGFLVNRLLLPYMNEAVLLAEEGVDIARIDKAVKHFGMPMGPFVLADEVGIDICWKVTGILAEAYAPRMRMTDLLDAMYEKEKLLGKKAGKGFYIHVPGKKREVNPAVAARAAEILKGKHPLHLSEEEIVERCMYIMINEAARCLEEGVVARAEYLDMALIMGTGFPPFRGGLLRYADELGIRTVVEGLKEMAGKCGDRYQPAPLLLKMAEEGKQFYETEV